MRARFLTDPQKRGTLGQPNCYPRPSTLTIISPRIEPPPGTGTKSASPAPSTTLNNAGGDLSYVIRPGDSLPAIAAIFHLPVQDLLRHNHLSPDAILHVGQVLLIPNPYAAQVRDLQSQIDTLRTSTANQVRGLQVQISSLRARNPDWARYLSDYASMAHVFEARNKELSSINAVLEHEVATLQWWRRAAIVAITLAVLMLAITLAVLVVRVPKARNP